MLISYPVLGVVQLQESPYGGRYPLAVFKVSRHEGLTAGWHGGLHLQVNATTTQGPVVRAIADGTVVAYRVPTKKPEKVDELAKHPLNYTGGWTDDGFVLLKHEKECGENRPVVFYSLYMHLNELKHKDLNGQGGEVKSNPKDSKTGKPLTLNRKLVLAMAGSIEGQTNQIHLEIFAGDEDFRKFFPLEPSKNAPTTAGSMDPWGEQYFLVPAGLPLHSRHPKADESPKSDLSVPTELLVALFYRDGRAVYRILDENGCELEHWEDPEPEAEYGLYNQALALGKGTQSRNYEVVRFGRFMDWPDVSKDPKPQQAAHSWHYLSMLDGWVDFADKDVKRLSDADFPAWYWKRIDLGQAGLDPANGLCEASKLLSAIDRNGDGNLPDLEFSNWAKQDANKALMRQMVVQFQSEWDGSEPDKRWGWVKKMWADPIQHEQAALKRRMDWVKAQKQKSESAKPIIQKRMQQATDWLAKLEERKSEAVKAVTAAEEKIAQARKAKEDFVNDVGSQGSGLVSKTPENKRQAAVGKKLAEMTNVIDAASDAKKKVESCVKAINPAIERAKAWKAREEARLQAAEDAVRNAPQEIEQLQEALNASAKKTADPKATDQAETDFQDYKNYMKALQFWEQLPGSPDSKVWHFHPLVFIEHFKKCHWLSKDDLVAVYGWYDPQNPDSPVAAKQRKQRETYRIALNRVMWKYGIISPTRMAHFLGQGGHECATLLTMEEGGDGTQYEDRQGLGNVQAGDGPRFKGKGMKQLTGCFNYVQYWVYRGWLDKVWLGRVWYKTKVRKNGVTTWAQPKDAPPNLDNPKPETLVKDPFNCIDTGGWFWEAGGRYPINGELDEVTGGWSFKSGAKSPINRVFVENQVDDRTIDMISDAINPGEEGDSKKGTGDHKLFDMRLRRRPRTWHVWNALHDLPEPIAVNDDIGKSGKAKSKARSSNKPAGNAIKSSGTSAKPAPQAPAKATAPKAVARKSWWQQLFG